MAADYFLYFSDLLGLPVMAGTKLLGRTYDLVIDPSEPFPQLQRLILKTKKRKGLWELDFAELVDRDKKRFLAKPGAEDKLKPDSHAGNWIHLRSEVLDRQVVDTHGAKLERVNDIHLLSQRPLELRVVHVEIGMRGIFRRLGCIRFVDWFTRWFFDYEIPPKFISWKYIQPLTSEHSDKLKLTTAHKDIKLIHSSDLADILEELSQHEAVSFVQALDVEKAADVLAEADTKTQKSVLMGIETEVAADILEDMPPDEAADVLADMPEDRVKSIMVEMDNEHIEELSELMSFDDETAGGLMTTEFLKVPENITVSQTLEIVKKKIQDAEIVHYIYVVNENNELKGVLSIKDLLVAKPSSSINEIMTTNVIALRANDDRKEMLRTFEKYRKICLPVVDEEQHILGIVDFRDFVEILVPKLSQ